MSYRYREMIVSHAPKRLKEAFPRRNHYVPVSTFSQQANAGLTSSAFDIEANIRDGDSRTGLDDRGTQEVLDIMRRERVKWVCQFHHCSDTDMPVSFDQARLIRQNRILAMNGIDASGVFAALSF